MFLRWGEKANFSSHPKMEVTFSAQENVVQGFPPITTEQTENRTAQLEGKEILLKKKEVNK